MTDETPQKIHLGKGILKPGTRPMKIHVDADGEWWICDADVDPDDRSFREKGCTDYSSIHNK